MAFKVDFPDQPFGDFDSFFEWYLIQIENNMPVPMSEVNASQTPSSYARMLPELSADQYEGAFNKIRETIALPKNVFLLYDGESETIYSYWDREKEVYRIAMNNTFYLCIAYPPVLKAGMTHEMGHIFNGDCLNTIECHGYCSNICADVRINGPIGDELCDQLASVLNFRKTEMPFVPKRWYPKYGLPVNEQGWPFDIAHNAYHQEVPEDDCTKPQAPPQGGEGGEGGEGQQGEGIPPNDPNAEKAKDSPLGGGGGTKGEEVPDKEQGEGESEGEGEGQDGEGQDGEGQEGEGQQGEGEKAQGELTSEEQAIQDKVARKGILKGARGSIEGLEELLKSTNITDKERRELTKKKEAFEDFIAKAEALS